MRILAVVVLAGLALAVPPRAYSQPARGATAPRPPGGEPEPVPVVLSVSGGVSLGSYQAGVNWALVAFLNRARRDPSYRTRHAELASRDTWVRPLPTFSLVSVAGASAGNINGVLSAIEYCSGVHSQTPDKSLFWQAWITTGWEQLFAPDSALTRRTRWRAGADSATAVVWRDPVADAALFHRRYYRVALYPAITTRMDSTRVEPDAACQVPVGITVTRLVPDVVEVGEGISALNQRFASVVVLGRDSANGVGVAFHQPPPEIQRAAASLGALVALDTRGKRQLDDEVVFRLVEASSAFPVAFAPRLLRYHPVTKIDTASLACPMLRMPTPACLGPDSAYFVDGGVFDNNPLDLALEVDRLLRCEPAPVRRPGPDSTVVPFCFARSPASVIYIDPGTLRGDLATLRRPEPTAERVGGIAAAVQLLRGAVPSARQYELQTFSRMGARYRALYGARNIRTTSRARPIMGEHVFAFGAFFGRPFREHDFYVGTYDAMHFVARSFLCETAYGPTALDDCVRARLKEFIQGYHVDVGPVGQVVMRDLFTSEYPRDRALPRLALDDAAATSPLKQQAVVLQALVRANDLLLRGEGYRGCAAGSLVDDIFCQGGLGVVLDSFATPPVRTAIDHWSRECARTPKIPGALDDCQADNTLVHLLDDRRAFAHRLLERMLYRLFEVEDEYPDRRNDYEAAVQVLEYGYQSRSEGVGRRGDWDPSSIPSYARGLPWLFHLAPNHVSGAPGTRLWRGAPPRRGGVYLGWRPSYYAVRGKVALVAPIDLMRTNAVPRGRDEPMWQSAVGVGVSVQPAFLHPRLSPMLLSAVQVSAQGSNDLRTLVPRYDRDALTYELSALLLASKVRVGLRRLPERLWGADRRPLALTIGMSDVNGLLYWIVTR